MITKPAFIREWLFSPRLEILSGIVVALAVIPEAIGFSVVAGVDPKVGLYASVVIACVIAFTGGRPAMISAATASTAVLMTSLVRDHGVQYLFAATILMGAFFNHRRTSQAWAVDAVRFSVRVDGLRKGTVLEQAAASAVVESHQPGVPGASSPG
jgi:hypothetical protein